MSTRAEPDAGEAFRRQLLRFAQTRARGGRLERLPEVLEALAAYPVAQRRMLERVALGLSPANAGPGIGSFHHPRALLVGDRPGPEWGASAPNWPFISGLRTGCSAWLAEQLEAAGAPEADLYWVNAFDKFDRATDAGFVADLGPGRVIALGKVAAGWCAASGFAYEEVHHPQYWKRFHSKHTYRLAQLLGRSTRGAR